MPLRARNPAEWPDGEPRPRSRTPPWRRPGSSHASEQITWADPAASASSPGPAGAATAIGRAFASPPAVPGRRWDLAIEDPAILDQFRRSLVGMPSNVTAETARAKVIAGIGPSDVDIIEQVSDAFAQLAAALQQSRVCGGDAAAGAATATSSGQLPDPRDLSQGNRV
jgi:DNA helicase-2/ATP-dependent DNA helicase PcrA